MGHDYDTLRSDRAYELRRRDDDYRTWWLVDKRTNHRWCFTDVVVNGYKENVFLRRHGTDETPSSGNRSAILDKESLPEWVLEELRHIDEHDTAMPLKDPRGDS